MLNMLRTTFPSVRTPQDDAISLAHTQDDVSMLNTLRFTLECPKDNSLHSNSPKTTSASPNTSRLMCPWFDRITPPSHLNTSGQWQQLRTCPGRSLALEHVQDDFLRSNASRTTLCSNTPGTTSVSPHVHRLASQDDAADLEHDQDNARS